MPDIIYHIDTYFLSIPKGKEVPGTGVTYFLKEIIILKGLRVYVYTVSTPI